MFKVNHYSNFKLNFKCFEHAKDMDYVILLKLNVIK